jgi:hypothetical protein
MDQQADWRWEYLGRSFSDLEHFLLSTVSFPL